MTAPEAVRAVGRSKHVRVGVSSVVATILILQQLGFMPTVKDSAVAKEIKQEETHEMTDRRQDLAIAAINQKQDSIIKLLSLLVSDKCMSVKDTMARVSLGCAYDRR